jgi:hypothetical protein
MMADYQLTFGETILRSIDGVYIPVDPVNADYVAYAAWVALLRIARLLTHFLSDGSAWLRFSSGPRCLMQFGMESEICAESLGQSSDAELCRQLGDPLERGSLEAVQSRPAPTLARVQSHP